MKFSYQHAGVADHSIKKLTAQLSVQKLNNIADAQTRAQIQDLAEKLYARVRPTFVVVIGIGGSSLGTQAVYEALRDHLEPDTYFFCADTVDGHMTHDLYVKIERELSCGTQFVFVIVSKSGKTTETMVNAAVFVDLLREFYPEKYHEYIVVITDKNSPLWNIAEEHNYAKLEVPHDVGGRFSVFTAVGLFPLALQGIDIEQLCEGAEQAQQDCTQVDENNYAATSAAILYEQYQAGKRIHDTFVFAPYLAQCGAWYRQLLGESIGKRYNKQGQEVRVGIVPTVSVGSNDLHSVAQLYLAGPYDIMTTFVSVKAKLWVKIPQNEFSCVDGIELGGPGVEVVQEAIFAGTQEAYVQDGRPFMRIELEDLNAFELGYLMQMKMYEIVYLGMLFDINVFDQPQVELYKKATRALLAKK